MIDKSVQTKLKQTKWVRFKVNKEPLFKSTNLEHKETNIRDKQALTGVKNLKECMNPT